MMAGSASGSSTRKNSRVGPIPMPNAASRTSSGTASSPAKLLRTRQLVAAGRIIVVEPTGDRAAPPPRPMIVLDRIRKQYDDGTVAVNELSLDVADGEIAVLVGPSGCGKTTTMRMINRLVEPTPGQIFVGGTEAMSQDPVVLRRGIGYVIQSVGLLPHRTIEQNIATVPSLLGWDDDR